MSYNFSVYFVFLSNTMLRLFSIQHLLLSDTGSDEKVFEHIQICMKALWCRNMLTILSLQYLTMI